LSWFRTERDPVELAVQSAQQLGPGSAADAVAAEIEDQAQAIPQPAREIAVEQPPPVPSVPQSVGLALPSPAKGMRTADELTAMILEDLTKIEGCPKRGVKVTVYGSNPWNCWLSFGTAAGPVHNKTEIQAFCQIITDRLKRLYDVSGSGWASSSTSFP
jgi:hypothetical protein